MVQERIQAALAHPGNQAPGLQEELIGTLKRYAELGIIDPTTGRAVEPIGFSELGLAAEWHCQVNRLVELGYHTELGMSAEDYAASLPKFEKQPSEYVGRLDMPMVVETRIGYVRQAELAGITVDPYLIDNAENTKPVSPKSSTPEKPYAGWFNKWGQRFAEPIAPTDAVEQLRDDEVGNGRLEGVTIQIHRPEYNQEGKFFDLIGEKVESDYVPCLDRWNDRPGLDAYWSDSALDGFRPSVRGSQIVTG